jgi:Tfp pilus assembly protein FimV
MPGNFRKGLLALVAGSLVMQTSVQAVGAGDYANPSQQYGTSQNRYGYYGNTAQPGAGYGYPYVGAPGYAAPGYTAPGYGNAESARPAAPADSTPSTDGDAGTAAEIAQLKQRVSELEAAIDRINSQLQLPTAPASSAAGEQSGIPAFNGQSGYPGTAPGSAALPGSGVPPASANQGSYDTTNVRQGTEYGSPAAGVGQGRPIGNTGTVGSMKRNPSTYVPPPQDIGPRVYEFNN